MADPVLVDINVPQFQENAVNAAPDFLFGTMTIQDPDDDFNGGTLVISGLLPEDVITFLNFGTGPGEPSFNSSTGEISFSGVVYGVLTGGSGGADLVITFNGAADSNIVSATLMNLQYQNTSDSPTPSRELTLIVTDAAGHSTAVVTQPGWEPLDSAADPLAGLPYIDGRLTPAFTDLDGDGDLDMAVGTYNGDIRYFENTGSSTAARFEERTGDDNPFDGIGVGYTAVQRFADVDGDGDMDLVSGSSGGQFHYFRNDGAAGFTERTGADNPFADMSTDYAGAVALGDLDGDGDLDALVAGFNGYANFYRNEGTATAPRFVYEWGPAQGAYFSSGPQTALLHDVDGDGDLDIVATNGLGHDVRYFENTGDASAPTFVERTGTDNPFASLYLEYSASPTFADLDGDGVDELIIGDNTTGLRVYRYEAGGVGPPTFQLVVNPEDEVQNGTSGVDTLVGGATADTLNGLGGNDILKGGLGDDELNGGAGDDSMRGEDGDDILDGADDNDALVGGDGHDILSGGAGNDILNGGAGMDFMYGGAGDDTYYLDELDGYSENANEGVDTIVVNFNAVMGANIENARISVNGDLYLQGNSLNNVITAVGGNNVLWGMAGDDTIDGGAGDDTLYGWDDNDHLIGAAGNDELYGGRGIDTLDGGAGADILDGHEGGDTMIGGAGNDTYHVDDAADVVIEDAAKGTDTVNASIDYTLTANVEHLILSGAGILFGRGNALNNVITGNAGQSLLNGEDGNDTLYGGGGSDYLVGGAGNDLLEGGAANDVMDGGLGNDTYFIDDAGDTIYEDVGEGTDTVYTLVNHTLSANVENLILQGPNAVFGNGNASHNIITGGGEANTLSGNDGNDTLNGNAGEDTLEGGAGVDKLFGGDDDDSLSGGAGNDQLDGGAGDDIIDGGAGVDRLTGGTGADRFVFLIDSLGLSGSGIAVQRDTILDFSLADGDRIDISGIDAIAGGNDDAFSFVDKFTKQAGQAMLFYNATADTTSLRLDIDGDGKIDHEIVINGHLLATDDAWIL